MTNMPYNTRRKSLSLPSLGIQLPTTSRAHRSNSKSSSPPSGEVAQPPTKKVKRDHEPMSPASSPQPRRIIEHTPPPSPGDAIRKVDTEGINDDIVIDVIEQLEKTGNRPHLIKELATVLASTNSNIAHSANPAALLSSRLASYQKRPWTALSPCPIAKELIPVHPRKVFFFLTTQPRTALPENSDDIITPEIKRLTPSISDPSVEDMEQDRSRMSPSPEVELYSPELDHDSPMPSTPGEKFDARNVQPIRHRNRAPSPPLEADEKGFTETATAVRARGLSLKAPQIELQVEERHEELYSHLALPGQDQKAMGSSPMIRGKMYDELHDVEMDMSSWALASPENIEVDELDGMMIGY